MDKVYFERLDTKEIKIVRISDYLMDKEDNIIAINSPLAQSLLDMEEDEETEVDIHGKKFMIRIIKIDKYFNKNQ